MANKKKTPDGFGRPDELNGDWLKLHEGHSLTHMKHTVINGSVGVEYDECRCYTCTKLARAAIREIQVSPEPKPKKKRSERTPTFAGFCMRS